MRVLTIDGEGLVTRSNIRFEMVEGVLYVIFVSGKTMHKIPVTDIMEIRES
jgi:hypothetical protein